MGAKSREYVVDIDGVEVLPRFAETINRKTLRALVALSTCAI